MLSNRLRGLFDHGTQAGDDFVNDLNAATAEGIEWRPPTTDGTQAGSLGEDSFSDDNDLGAKLPSERCIMGQLKPRILKSYCAART